jgi:hypothetical protein
VLIAQPARAVLSALAALQQCRHRREHNTASGERAHARQRRAPRAPPRTAPRPPGSACRTSSPNSAPRTPVARMRAHALSEQSGGARVQGSHAHTHTWGLWLIWGVP